MENTLTSEFFDNNEITDIEIHYLHETREGDILNIYKLQEKDEIKFYITSGEIETWGTGLRKIYNVCKKENLKVDFEDRKLAFFVVFYRKNLEGLIENTEKDLSSKVDDKELFKEYMEIIEKLVKKMRQLI